MSSGGTIVAIDTATRQATIALGDETGRLIAGRGWRTEHRHGERLLDLLDDVLREAGTDPSGVSAVVCGTGPGSFTGLRVGLTTGKLLAYALRRPIVGIPTALALGVAAAEAGTDAVVVVLPAGPSDRYRARVVFGPATPQLDGAPQLIRAGEQTAIDAARDGRLVAVDLEPADANPDAVERGGRALAGLGAALLELGAAALRDGRVDDVAELVPLYVTLPRGVTHDAGLRWSPDLR